MPEATVDGVPIDDLIKIENHAWCRMERTSDREVRERFTVYVQFTYDYPEEDKTVFSYEEIDIDAVDETDARTIADLVLLRDYEEGGKIYRVVHRPQGVMYW